MLVQQLVHVRSNVPDCEKEYRKQMVSAKYNLNLQK